MSEPSITTSNPPIPRQTPATIASQPVSTPTHGAGGSFTVISSAHIAAPADVAFTVLLDHTAWPEWNRFVRLVTVTSSPAPTEPSADAGPLETAVQRDDGSRYLKKGTQMAFNVHLDPDNATSHTRQGMEVTLLEPYGSGSQQHGWRVAWRGTSIPSLLLRTERVQELVDDGSGGCEYTCWETMYGPLAPVVRLTTGKSLEKGFQCWTEDLKRRAESIASGAGGEAARAAAGGALGTSRGD